MEIEEKLRALSYDPIEAMVLLAQHPDSSLELQGKMASELAQYVLPKRKAVEHSVEAGTQLAFVMFGQPEAKDLVTWEHQQCLPAPSDQK